MTEPWDEKPGWLIHRLRSVGEPGALRDMCREAANLIAEWQVEIGRLRGHAGRLQGALHEIDVSLLSPEAVERDTEIVGGPVPLYAVECDEVGVVRRVKAEIEKLRREVSESNREWERIVCAIGPWPGDDAATMVGEMRAELDRLREGEGA